VIRIWWRAARALRRRLGRDEGTAVVEFVVLGVLVTIPIFYLVVTLARLHAGAYAVSLASREAGRTFVTAPSEASAPGRAQSAARIAFEDQGFGGQGSVAVSCAASPCLTRDAQVRTRASLAVELPFIPDVVADAVPSSITLTATHVEAVDRYGDTS
jgi:hypothetical protein